VEAGSGDVASLEQDPFAIAPGVVARLAIDRVTLAAALEEPKLIDPELYATAEVFFG